MSFPTPWAGLPALSALPINNERDGLRHWTECTQSSCIMAVHNWRPDVPVTNAERDALDATPPHKPKTATTVRERDACLLARYGWAGLRTGSYARLYDLLAAGGVGQFPGQGVYPGVTSFTGGHGLAIGPAAARSAWVRDPLRTAGHWADWDEIVAWCWGPDQVAVYPAYDPTMIAELQPLLGVGDMSASERLPEPSSGTVPGPKSTPAPSEALASTVTGAATGGADWSLVALAGVVVALAIMGRKARTE